MSLLDRLRGNPDPEDDRPESSPRRQPEIIRGREGYASFSLAALRERIEAQLELELAGRLDILREDGDEATCRELVAQVGDYVLTVESVPLTAPERQQLYAEVYSNVFGFGPLDLFLADDNVIGLTLDGADHATVWRLDGSAETVSPPFEDQAHLRRILERIAARGGLADLDAEPIVEVGAVLHDRPVRMALVMPPFSPVIHVELRCHPRSAIGPDDLRADGRLTVADEVLLKAIVASDAGVLIVGEPASGKTTLLDALLAWLPAGGVGVCVERAREMRLPEGLSRLSPVAPGGEEGPTTFAELFGKALDQSPAVLVADELRGDEALAVWQALNSESIRLVATFRSSTEPARLSSALQMLIRRGQQAIVQEELQTRLVERLPFVVLVESGPKGVQIRGIAEWQVCDSAPCLVMLTDRGRVTGTQPRHDLGLPADFWAAEA